MNVRRRGAAAAATGAPDAPPEPLKLPPIVKGTAPKNPYPADKIARGAFLVQMGQCNDCHTPWQFDAEIGMPVPDMTRMLSGHPEGAPDPLGEYKMGDMAVIGPTFTSFKLAFGVVYTANLTPDIDTGTGGWTEEMFVKIFRTGKHLGGEGRPVLPPMPWFNLVPLSDDDLVAIFAYLRSIPPIKNGVPSPKVPDAAMPGIDKGWGVLLERMAAAKP